MKFSTARQASEHASQTRYLPATSGAAPPLNPPNVAARCLCCRRLQLCRWRPVLVGLMFTMMLACCSTISVLSSKLGRINVKIGILLDESEHEQASMFIRTIKMINEREDEAIRQLLNISSARAKPGELQAANTAKQPLGPGSISPLSFRRRSRQTNSTILLDSWTHQDRLERELGLLDASRRLQLHNADVPPGQDLVESISLAKEEKDLAPIDLDGRTTAEEWNDDHEHHRHYNRDTMDPSNGASDAAGGGRSRRFYARDASELHIKLEPMIEFLQDKQSSLEADGKVCQLIESGVHAIVGPTDGVSIQHVQSICDNLEIPYIELRPFIGGSLASPISVPSPASSSSGAFQFASSGGGASDGAYASASIGVPPPHLDGSRHEQGSMQHLATTHVSRRPTGLASNLVVGPKEEVGSGWQQTNNQPAQNVGEGVGVNTGGEEKSNIDDNVSLVPGVNSLLRSNAAGNGGEGGNDNGLFTMMKVTFDGLAQNNAHSMMTKAKDGLMPRLNGSSENNNDHLLRSVRNPSGGGSSTSYSQPATSANRLEDLTLNLYPPSHMLNSAYIDLIYALNWTSFAIVYEDGSSMIKLQDLFRESSGSWANRWRIKLFRFDPNSLETMESDQRQHQLRRRPMTNTDNGGGAGSENGPGGSGRQSNNLNVAPASTAPQAMGAQMIVAHGGSNAINEHQAQNNVNNQFVVNRNIIGNNNDLFKQSKNLLHQQQDDVRAFPQSGPSRVGGRRQSQASGVTFRDVFWRVKLSGEHNVLLDVKTENLYDALKQAQQVGCMTEEYSYVITSLDLHMIDLEDFKYSQTKITGFSLIQVAKTHFSLDTGSPQDSIDRHRYAAGQDQNDGGLPLFDDRYLENLGFQSQYGGQSEENSLASLENALKSGRKIKLGNPQTQNKKKLSPDTSGGSNSNNTGGSKLSSSLQSWLNWAKEAAYNDLYRRELLQSSPASLGLLPTVDRNNEQRLFDFFLQQQERNMSRIRLSTSSAVLHDSLLIFMLGLNELDPNGNFLREQQQQALTCSLDSQPWPHGSSMVNYMRQTSFTGLTGSISFDQRGLRTDFKLDVMGIAPNIRLVKVGEWHSRNATNSRNGAGGYSPQFSGDSLPNNSQDKTNGDGSDVDSVKSYDELSSRYESELKKYTKMLADGQRVEVPYTKPVSPNGALKVNDIIFERLYREQADQIDTLVVTAKLSQPYFMLKETPNKLDGNDQFEGYAVDLIHELSKLVNFKYKWREVADKKYGSKEVLPNGTVVWNGMIGEIVRGQADLAIVDLTITAQREEAVDFTLPFMNTGISILFKKPTTKVTTLFSFLSPFSSDVWAYVLAAYCGISAILFLVGHVSPYEWADPHPCRHLSDDEETVLKNQFSLLNAFWFTIGSLMQQGSDLTPRSMSTRTIAGIWYFFTLIMISSYTANLAAFLTVEKVVYPIENVRDLSNQQEIKYGCVESGSTCTFFHDSQIDTYKKINETMRRYRTYVRSNDEGQKRVGEGKFAFFMESTTIEYIVERNCNLTQIGGLIDSKGYGLATSKKSRHKRPYRTLLNEGILHLQETGLLHVLKNRWWKERRGGGTCTDDGKGGGVTELSLANVGGVFVVLLGGLGISFLVAIAEFMWRSKRGGSTRDRMCEEMMNDLKFALACKSSTKPMKPNNGKISRRGMRQQSSIMSQYDQPINDSSRHPALIESHVNSAVKFNAKECDPILLHAMLTMLTQQQQNQQPHQHQIIGEAQTMSFPFNLNINKLETDGENVVGPHNDVNKATKLGEIQTSRYPGNSNDAFDTAAISKRRGMLHAQQTIDINDDNAIRSRNNNHHQHN